MSNDRMRQLLRREGRRDVHICFICQCPARAGLRLQALGSAMLEPEEIKMLTARDILGFLWRTRVVS